MSKQTELAQVADTITVNSGKIGIGTSLPSAPLAVESGTADSTIAKFTGANSTRGMAISTYTADGFADAGVDIYGLRELRFSTNVSEAMRIDSSGNLLVGKTSSSSTTAGAEIFGSGYQFLTNDGVSLYLTRPSTDGEMLRFLKGTTTVGSIASRSGVVISVVLDPRSGGMGITGSQASLMPSNNDGTPIDNSKDLGRSDYRWDDIFATNGTIQTSDRNEKQDIAELSDAEQRVAVAAKGLLRKFRWRDAVEAKGDDARTHFGIIAQDLQAAFAAEGLDAGRYAMFMSNTWWETQTEVPAVEAVAEVLDEEGNVITEAVEAVDAYTRTDTYDTQEEAPEGATERTRLGVRYSELLAFIIGAL